MELKQYATLLWRWAWLIILATFLASASAYINGRMQTPVYQASTTVLIDQAPDASTPDMTSLSLSERLASTYVQLLTKYPVLEEVIGRMDLNMQPGSLKGIIQVSPIQETQLIEIKVEHTDPVVAAEIANTLVEVFSEQNLEFQARRYADSKENLSAQLVKVEGQIQQAKDAVEDMGSPHTDAGEAKLERLQNELTNLQTSYTSLLQSYEGLRLAEAQSVSNIVQVEAAFPSASSIHPNIMMNTKVAGVVGLMLAVGLIFLIEYLDDTIKSTEEASEGLGLPVIGFVAKVNGQSDGVPLVVREPRSPVAEAFRSLRSNIQFSSIDIPIKTLLITSPGPREGKSTVAANLALVMAQGGKNVLLIDTDMRKPHLHRIMGVPNRLGLSDLFVRHPSEYNGIIRRWEEKNLYLITSGKLPPNPAELLGLERMSKILNMLKEKYDFIVLDSPPVGVVTDPVVLSARVDATLLVVEPKRTRMGAAVQALEQLRRADANLIGIVFNNVNLKRAGYYYYNYAYSYIDGKDGKGPHRNLKSKKQKKSAKGVGVGARERGSVSAGERGSVGAGEHGSVGAGEQSREGAESSQKVDKLLSR